MAKIEQIRKYIRAPTLESVWYKVDAKNQYLDKFALEMARILSGRARPTFSHYQNLGDYLVITNTNKIVYPDKSWKDNYYFTKTGIPGGDRYRNAEYFHSRDGTFILYKEIKFQLRTTPYRPEMLEKLFLFPDDNHPFMDNALVQLDISKFDGIHNDQRLSDITSEMLQNYPKLQFNPIPNYKTNLIQNIKNNI